MPKRAEVRLKGPQSGAERLRIKATNYNTRPSELNVYYLSRAVSRSNAQRSVRASGDQMTAMGLGVSSGLASSDRTRAGCRRGKCPRRDRERRGRGRAAAVCGVITSSSTPQNRSHWKFKFSRLFEKVEVDPKNWTGPKVSLHCPKERAWQDDIGSTRALSKRSSRSNALKGSRRSRN